MPSSKLFFIFGAVALLLICPSQGHVPKDDNQAHQPGAGIEEAEEVQVDGGFKANALTDKIISEVEKEIDKKNVDRVSLPDFEEKFVKKVGGLGITGFFKGENGWLESLKSLERRGNARAYLNETSFYLNATLGLKTLKLGMKYHARFSFVRSSGNMTATVQNNAFSFLGGVDKSTEECRLVLRSLKIAELGKIDVDITGRGKLLDIIRSTVVTEVTHLFRKNIRTLLESKMQDLLRKQLAKTKCPDLPIFFS